MCIIAGTNGGRWFHNHLFTCIFGEEYHGIIFQIRIDQSMSVLMGFQELFVVNIPKTQ